MTLARKGLDAFVHGDFAAAATLYGQATALEPDVPAFVFGQARAEQELGQLAAARIQFARVLALTATEHPLHAKAVTALDSLRPAPEQVVVAPATPTVALPLVVTATVAAAPPQAQPQVAAALPPPVLLAAPIARSQVVAPSAWVRPSAYTGLALGVAAVAVGAGLAISASSAQRSLDDKQMPDGRYDVTQISYVDGANAQRSINGRWTWAGVAGGVGAAAVATAIWLLVNKHDVEPQARVAHAVETLADRSGHDGDD